MSAITEINERAGDLQLREAEASWGRLTLGHLEELTAALPAGTLMVDVPYFMHGRWAECAARRAGSFEPMWAFMIAFMPLSLIMPISLIMLLSLIMPLSLTMRASVLAARDLQQTFMETRSKPSFDCSTVITGFVPV